MHEAARGLSTTTILAAAAVATATTLSAISTSDKPSDTSSSTNPRSYVSWAQYASDRRSSLQRRKLEITKKLEKVSNTVNNRKECTQFQQNLKSKPKETSQTVSKNQISDKIEPISAKDFDPEPESQTLDMTELSEALLQYVSINGINDEANLNPYDDAESYFLKKESMKLKKEERINYILTHRWDPGWLKLIRNRYCFPFVVISFIILIFTMTSSNWIRFGIVLFNFNFLLFNFFSKDKQKAGLWKICNISDSNLNSYNFEIIRNSSSIVSSNNETSSFLKAYITKKSSLIDKIMIIQNQIELCDSKFYLKEGIFYLNFLFIFLSHLKNIRFNLL